MARCTKVTDLLGDFDVDQEDSSSPPQWWKSGALASFAFLVTHLAKPESVVPSWIRDNSVGVAIVHLLVFLIMWALASRVVV